MNLTMRSRKVSVVLIFLNEQKYLQEAIESVLAQTYFNWELLLVDDGSTDRSTNIAKEYASRYSRKIVYLEHQAHQNKGMSATRNLGWKCATGEFIAFLDGDDVWVPEKLSEQVAILEKHPSVGLVCGAALYWHSWRQEATSADEVVRVGAPQNEIFYPPALLLQVYPLGKGAAPCISVMVRKNVLEEIGGFEEHFRNLYEDQAFLVKIYLHTPVYVASNAWLQYRQHADSCVATVHQQGKYHSLRTYFLQWLSNYLQQNGIQSPEVWTAWQKAFTPYKAPLLRKAVALIRQYFQLLTSSWKHAR